MKYITDELGQPEYVVLTLKEFHNMREGGDSLSVESIDYPPSRHDGFTDAWGRLDEKTGEIMLKSLVKQRDDS